LIEKDKRETGAGKGAGFKKKRKKQTKDGPGFLKNPTRGNQREEEEGEDPGAP